MTGLTKQAASVTMSPGDWSIETWLERIARQELGELRYGRSANLTTPDCVLNPGPLRDALIKEFAFKAFSELHGTKGICNLATLAERHVDFEYLMTQIFDEARHTSNFRQHLIDLDFGGGEVDTAMAELNSGAMRQIITPLQEYFDYYLHDRRSYLCCVSIITIILEGVLAPSAELGELKWRPFDPIASDIQKNANKDEVRHLAVCAEIVRRDTARDFKALKEVTNCVKEGMDLWERLPVAEMMFDREQDYQAGLEEYRKMAKEQVLEDGVLLLDSTPESRIELAHRWAQEMQGSRLHYMNIKI